MTHEGGLTRRAAIGVFFVVAAGAAGCTASGSPPGDPAQTTTSAPPPTDREAYIAGGPAPLDPAVFEHGAFVGGIDIQYFGARTSPTAMEADAKYAVYFKGNYTPPAPGDRNGIRLNAMVDPRDGDRLLFKGAIIDTITLPNEIVLGLHNITRIEGGIEINGEVFEGRVAGANGTMVVGDRLTIWVPDPHFPDLVNRFDYQVVESEAGGDFVIVDVGPGYEDLIYRATPADDVYQLSLYTCWPPNQSIRRLVTRLHKVGSSIQEGSVRPVD